MEKLPLLLWERIIMYEVVSTYHVVDSNWFYIFITCFSGILLLVAIGVALGVFLGGLLLTLAIYYLKR